MIVRKWHGWVNQPKKDKAWHESDVADELEELRQATKLIHKWSELSDVVYTVTRARWSGHDLDFPIPRAKVYAGYVYMFPKYSSRALFFRRAGKKAGAKQVLECVRNPRKQHKLETIAKQNKIDVDRFILVCKKQQKYWPLLP